MDGVFSRLRPDDEALRTPVLVGHQHWNKTEAIQARVARHSPASHAEGMSIVDSDTV